MFCDSKRFKLRYRYSTVDSIVPVTCYFDPSLRLSYLLSVLSLILTIEHVRVFCDNTIAGRKFFFFYSDNRDKSNYVIGTIQRMPDYYLSHAIQIVHLFSCTIYTRIYAYIGKE